MLSRLAPLALVAACGVEIDGGSKGTPDSPRPVDAAIDTPSPDARPCTAGETNVTADGTCLMLFSSVTKSWAEANTICQNLQTHLAILDTAAKHTAAKTLAGVNNAWIGLTDLANENQFRWVDINVPFSYTAWDPNEPSNGATVYEEDCVVIAGARGGDWDDRPCSAQIANAPAGCCSYAYICQF
jgi:hypothetical protein